MKRWLAFIVTLLLFCLPVYAEEGTALSLDSSPASNGLAEIAVVLNGNPGFVSYQLDIAYDAACLQPLELTSGIGGMPAYNFLEADDQSSCVKVAYASAMPVQENGELFRIRFQIRETLSAGQSAALRLENVHFYSQDGTEFTLTLKDGQIYVPTVPSEETGTTTAEEAGAGPSGSNPGTNPPGDADSSVTGNTATTLSAGASSSDGTGTVPTGGANITSGGEANAPAAGNGEEQPENTVLPILILIGVLAAAAGALIAVGIYQRRKSAGTGWK